MNEVEGDSLKKQEDSPTFQDVFPSETKGSGKVRPNNARTGGNQGKAGFKKKTPCKMCGFLLDLNRDAHDGGTFDGNGAMGTVAKSTATSTINGVSYTEPYGDQSHRKGGGCPHCGSRNGAAETETGGPGPSPTQQVRPGF